MSRTNHSRQIITIGLVVLLCALLPTVGWSKDDPPELLPGIKAQAELRAAADSLYESGDFGAALAAYEPLTSQGDKFAQFRTSLIHYFGLTGEADKVEAYAWATVAQEDGIVMLEKYAMLIAQELGLHQTDLARSRYFELDALGGAALIGTRASDLRVECSGSRLGKNCERIARHGDRSPAETYGDRGLPPFAFDDAYLAEFNREYGNRILADFDRLDRAAAKD